MKKRHIKILEDYPSVKKALSVDGAIRMVDGRWSQGFVDEEDIVDCVKFGICKIEKRSGVSFAVIAEDV